MHFAFAHLPEQYETHGMPTQGDDAILEKSNKQAKKLKAIMMPVSGKHAGVMKKQLLHRYLRDAQGKKRVGSAAGTVAYHRSHRMPASTSEQMLVLQGALSVRRAARCFRFTSARKTATLYVKHEEKKRVSLQNLEALRGAGRSAWGRLQEMNVS